MKSTEHRPERVAYQVYFDQLEARLALSAQSLADVLIQTQVEDNSLAQPIQPLNELASVEIEQHLTQAHSASGLATARQQYGLDGRGQTVAVIDSGIAWDHVALGKGYGANYRVVGGWDFTEENDANPYDDGPTGFHGTHVAGIIGSDDAKNPGVAPGADLVALRVFNDAGQGNLAWVEKALQWVHTNRNTFENPITTVNLSLGTVWNSGTVPPWAMLEDEFAQLYKDGIVVTVSAGNSFAQYQTPGLSYPAASQWVLPVASVGDNGTLSNFSQRNERVLAAPGEKILSTVPDHVFGKDGKVNDWAEASGTSMSAPYVAGASVLVREAMELVGVNTITPQGIYQFLRDTADTIYDSVTKASYLRLNLGRALDQLLPDDNVGNALADAQSVTVKDDMITNGWVNTLTDRDVYKFTATQDATIRLTADSKAIDRFQWSLWTGSQAGANVEGDTFAFNVKAGQTYAVGLAGIGEIGSFSMKWDIEGSTPVTPPPPPPPPPPPAAATELGSIQQRFEQTGAGKTFNATASQAGLFTVVWDPTGTANGKGSLEVRDASGKLYSDTTWENGQLRLDVNANAGEKFQIKLNGVAAEVGELSLTNLVRQQGSALTVGGTTRNDSYSLDLSNGVKVGVGNVAYSFGANQIQSVNLDAQAGSDTINIIGSRGNDKVDMLQGETRVAAGNLRVTARGLENVAFQGNGGADSAYLYDSAGNDQLTMRPTTAQLTGNGYRFSVAATAQVFVHATAGGNDTASMYDSVGNDVFAFRPEFASLTGAGYFNYARGFDSVSAFGTAGGTDTAQLYDSRGNDRFESRGDAAQITGSGFAGYTKGFERVDAFGTAGGYDTAALYATASNARFVGAGSFVQVVDGAWTRQVLAFDKVDRFAGAAMQRMSESLDLAPPSANDTAANDSAANASSAVGNAGNGASSSSAAPNPINTPSYGNQGLGGGDRQESLASRQQSSSSTMGPTWSGSKNVETRSLSDSRTVAWEDQLLVEVLDLRSWAAQKLVLPEEDLIRDPSRELAILDSIFAKS